MEKMTKASIATAIAMAFSSISVAYANDYLTIDSLSIQPNGKSRENSANPNAKVRVTIKTAADIPVDGTAGAFGYAILTESGNGSPVSPGNVLVLVTHLGLDDSEFEDAVSGFHTHVLDLILASDACSGADLEVDLEGSGANEGFDLDAGWHINGNVAKIKPVPFDLLNLNSSGAPEVEAVVSFTVEPRVVESRLHLCVSIVDGVVF